jgi:Mce-associated membrane protein
MPSPERPTGALDSDRCDDPTLAEAMEEAARAEARAQAARARAAQLSRKADATSSDRADTIATMGPNDTDGAAVDENAGEPQPAPLGWARLRRRVLLRPKSVRATGARIAAGLKRPGRKTLAVGAAVILICTSLGTSGYVVWYHRKSQEQRQRAAEFAAAARQSAITLMSINSDKAREDLQRVIDDATGQFKNQMLLTANGLVESVEQSKVSTKATVQAVAVESMTADSGVVLVTTKSEVINPDKTKPPPRSWRIVMNLQRDGGQLKMSRVEFLP